MNYIFFMNYILIRLYKLYYFLGVFIFYYFDKYSNLGVISKVCRTSSTQFTRVLMCYVCFLKIVFSLNCLDANLDGNHWMHCFLNL